MSDVCTTEAEAAAFGWTRLRGKMKLGVSGKHWLGPVVIIGVVLLLMWSVHTRH